MASRLGTPPLLWTPTTLLEYTDYLHKYTPDPVEPVAHIQSVFIADYVTLTPADGTLKLRGRIEDFHYDGSLYGFFGKLRKHADITAPIFKYETKNMPALAVNGVMKSPEEYVNNTWSISSLTVTQTEANNFTDKSSIFLEQWRSTNPSDSLQRRFETARLNPFNWQNNPELKQQYMTKWNEAHELSELYRYGTTTHVDEIEISNGKGSILNALSYCGTKSVVIGGTAVKFDAHLDFFTTTLEISNVPVDGIATVTWLSWWQHFDGTDEQFDRLIHLNDWLWDHYRIPQKLSMPELMFGFGGATPMAEAMGISLVDLLYLYATPYTHGVEWEGRSGCVFQFVSGLQPPPCEYFDYWWCSTKYADSFGVGQELGIGFDNVGGGYATLYTGFRSTMQSGDTIPYDAGFVGTYEEPGWGTEYFFMHAWRVPWYTGESRTYSAKVNSCPIKPAYIFQAQKEADNHWGFYDFEDLDEPLIIPRGNIRIRGQTVKYDYVNHLMKGNAVKRVIEDEEVNKYDYNLTLYYSPIYSFKQPSIFPTPLLLLHKIVYPDSKRYGTSGFVAVADGDTHGNGCRYSGQNGTGAYVFNTSTFGNTPRTYFTSFKSYDAGYKNDESDEQIGKSVEAIVYEGEDVIIKELDTFGNTINTIFINGEIGKRIFVAASLQFPTIVASGSKKIFLDTNFTPFLEVGSDNNAT